MQTRALFALLQNAKITTAQKISVLLIKSRLEHTKQILQYVNAQTVRALRLKSVAKDLRKR